MKLNPGHSASQRQFQARLQLQRELRRQDSESVDRLLVASLPAGADLFQSELPIPHFASVDALVVAGNQHFETLENVDLAGFRNDKALGQLVLREAREQLERFHPDSSSEDFRRDLRRLVHARYLQGHGVQVQSHLDDQELSRLRKYLQRQDSNCNVADAVRAINQALASGQEQVETLLLKAEEHLFQERGVQAADFQAKFASRFNLQELGQLRDFSDGWAVAQSGSFLNQAEGQNPTEMGHDLARKLLASHGYRQVEKLSPETILCLLRDRNAEGPQTNARMAQVVNLAVAAGETDYFTLTTLANEAILEDLGLDARSMARLQVSDKKLNAAYPDLAPGEARAIRTRVLRDLLRVLPHEERQLALSHLKKNGANLIDAEEQLSKHLGQRIRHYSGYATGYGKMGAMQRANLASALSRLPDEVRQRAFEGPRKEVLDRLEGSIESRFQIEVHRQAGKAPNGNAEYAPFVQDWTLQGMADLYNALEAMSRQGQLPPGLAGTTTLSFMQGAPRTLPMLPLNHGLPALASEPWDRPGSNAFPSGQSGFFGECSQDAQGNDQVVIYDDALLGGNGDSAEGTTLGEATILHELGHAIQLGGTPGAPEPQRSRETQLRMAEWSSLSRWREPDQRLADGRIGDYQYYYDPAVQVQHREQVATSYGASDPCEDFAEYTPFFFKDPATAMGLSLEKFHYLNQLVGHYYSPEQILEVAARSGISAVELAQAEQRMQTKVSAAPGEAGLLAA